MTAGDPDQDCTPAERTQRALHRAVDRILDVWPRALQDVNARGFPSGRGYDVVSRGSSDSTSVEAAALTPNPAVEWIRDAERVCRQIIVLAAGP